MAVWTTIGIDPSARKLAGVLSRGTDWEIVKRTMPRDIESRCKAAYIWIRWLAREAPRPVAFFIEEPVLGRGGAAGTLPLAKIHGAMLAAAMVAGADLVVPVNPSSWKKRIVGTIPRGTNHKLYVKAHVRQYWAELYAEADGDSDVCDAGCINRYGVEILRLRKLLPQQGIIRERKTRSVRRAATTRL